MKMDLIQPFISAVDAVLAETLQSPVTVSDLAMEDEGYRKRGVAARIEFKGEIEGRVILDVEPRAAVRVASNMSGEEVAESEQIVRETVCELANMVIGNAVTLLNDRGFKFKVFPPSIHLEEQIPNAGRKLRRWCFRLLPSRGACSSILRCTTCVGGRGSGGRFRFREIVA